MTNDPPTVLIVEDEEPLATAYERVLSTEYTVRTAHDGQEALDKVTESVDVVLLDRRMPTMDGEEVLTEIRKQGLEVRVAMVTAVDPDFDTTDMEFDTYLVKPVSNETLRAVVEELLALSPRDDRMRELFRLSQKKSILEERKPDTVLAESAAYASLQERYAELDGRIRIDGQGDRFFTNSIENSPSES